MRKNPIQKKALRKVEQRAVRVQKEKRDQKRRQLLGLESKAESQRRVAEILNKISLKKASQYNHIKNQVGNPPGFFYYLIKNKLIDF